MDVQVNNKNISLTKQDFLAAGGEGSIYIKGSTAYKIYADPHKMIPVGKIQELSILTDPNIIKPEAIILSNHKPVGYTMRFVKDTHALCQLFTKSFKDRYGLTSDMCLDLMRQMQRTIHHIHSHNILIVDLNEMNFLSNNKFDEVFFIDVDSYQTSHYQATALMESVRDRHSKSFNEGTDWFSFAIVTFQLLIGIHPYKGKHPKIKTLDERMEHNISVFNKDVGVPQSCLSFNTIPKPYLDWYMATFERGLREPPPMDMSKSIAVAVASVITGSNNFEIKELFSCKWDIYQYARYLQGECLVGNGICFNRRHYLADGMPCHIGFFGSTPIAARIKNDQVELINVRTQQGITTQISAEKLMSYNSRIYAKSGENILEIQLFGAEAQPVAGTKVVGKVLGHATQVFTGIIIQNLLGTYYASIFPEEGKCIQERLAFLDGYRIIDAKYDNGVIMAVGIRNGKYDRFIYCADSQQLKKVEDISFSGLNFVVLDSGVCVSINEHGQVELFNKNDITKMKVIDDPAIHGGLKLFSDGAQVLAANGNKLCSIKMR
jgi:hypothetical protein